MIIQTINNIRDQILQYQPYFNVGYADVRLFEYSDRKGIFMETSLEELDFANVLDTNSFYLRRIGDMNTSGNAASGVTVSYKLRLVAQASDVDQYLMLECLMSTLLLPCQANSITNIELSPERILKNEGATPLNIQAALSRAKNSKFVQIDFSVYETFNPTDVANCVCNPCKNCN